jgi:hypothetical protein
MLNPYGEAQSFGNAVTVDTVNPCFEVDVPMKAPYKFVPNGFTYNGGAGDYPPGQVLSISSYQIATSTWGQS